MQHWTTLTDKRHREPEPLPYIDLLYSTAVNTRSRCVEQPWGRLFQLRCRGNCDATRWGRALATCRQTIPLWLRYVDDTYRRLQRRNWRFSPLPCQTERRHPVYQRSRIKWKTFFSRLFGKLRQQRGTNGSVQKTDATDRLFDESSYNPTDRKQSYKIKCFDCRLPPLVWLAEIFTRDWLKTNELREMVMLKLSSLYIINWQATTLPGTLPNS